jgi:glycosyltransferase involved in cell wall biosynthesis
VKKVIVSVSNDLSTDQRVNRTCKALAEAGYEVFIVGRKLKESLDYKPQDFKHHRIKLLFNKGPLFYAELNIRLFFFLLFKSADIFYANDLDTLLPNYLASVIRRKKLVYDTHEYFCFVPELMSRPRVRRVWQGVEQFVFPNLKNIITVNDSIAEQYKRQYGKELTVIRNVPEKKLFDALPLKSRSLLALPEDKKIIILQGAGININRGAEEAVQAMKYVDEAILLIVGSGDVINNLKELAKHPDVRQKVIFKPKMPFSDLISFTRIADLGLTLDKADNLNYEYSLPNKLFDYIHSEIPVLASPLVEVKKVVLHHNVGRLIENHDPVHIAILIKEMIFNDEHQTEWRENARKAALELNWETEKIKLLSLFERLEKE